MEANHPLRRGRVSKQRACARCTTAKAKCSYSNPGACDRCTRLRRECLPLESSRRRRNGTRVDKLEEKLEEVLAILSAQKNQPTPQSTLGGAGSAGPLTPIATATDGTPETINVSGAFTDDGSLPSISVPPIPPPLEINQTTNPDPIERGLLRIQDAEACLERFQSVKSNYFPFVKIPLDMTAEVLRQQKPFLFLCIVTACSEDNIPLQNILQVDIKRVITERIVINNERSLELLQGLLVHLAWYHYHFEVKSKQLHLILQMTVAVLNDLGLDRPVYGFDPNEPYSGDFSTPSFDGPDDPVSDVAAGCRALLGCYYLSSAIYMHRKIVVVRNSKWMHACCRILAERKQYPSDISLKTYINARGLAWRISDTFTNEDGDQTGLYTNKAILEAAMNAFKSELAQLQADVARHSPYNYFLQIELATLTVSVHEPALLGHDAASTSSTYLGLHSSQLWALLSACRILIASSLSIPASAVTQLPTPAFHMMWYAFIVLSRLLLLPSTRGWDSELARKEANIEELARMAKDKLAESAALLRNGSDAPHKDIWGFFLKITDSMLAWHQKRLQTSGDDIALPAGVEELPGISELPQNPLNAVRMLLGSCSFMAKRASQEAGEERSGPSNDTGTDNRYAGNTGGTAGQTHDVPQTEYVLNSVFDDAVWQSLLDEFFTIPIT